MFEEIIKDQATGNTYEIHIDYLEYFVPNATTVIKNYYGTSKEAQVRSFVPRETVTADIIRYVAPLRLYLADEWKSRYQKIWEDILALEMIATAVSNPGKQRGTNFNRNLVANIIHYLSGRGVYTRYSPTLFTVLLQGNKDHPVRAALAADPPTKIVSRLNRYFE